LKKDLGGGCPGNAAHNQGVGGSSLVVYHEIKKFILQLKKESRWVGGGGVSQVKKEPKTRANEEDGVEGGGGTT